MPTELQFSVSDSDQSWWKSNFTSTLEYFDTLNLLKFATNSVRIDPALFQMYSPAKLRLMSKEDDGVLSYLNNLSLLFSRDVIAQIRVNTVFGHADFEYQFKTSAASKWQTCSQFATDEGLSVAQLSTVAYFAKVGKNQAEQLEALANVKASMAAFPEFYERIELSDTLAAINISEVDSLRPYWSEAGENKTIGFTAQITSTDKTVKQVKLVPNMQIGKKPVLSLGPKEYLLLTNDESALVGHAKSNLRNIAAQQAAVVSTDISLLSPAGIDVESLDLTDFGPRVLGFEVLKAAPRLEAQSGIRWYDDGIGPALAITLIDENGNSQDLKLPPRAEDLIALRTSVSHEIERMNADPAAIPQAIEANGRQLLPSVNLLQILDTCLAVTKASNDKDGVESRRSRLSAIVDSDKSSAHNSAKINLEDIACVLKPGMQPYDYQIDGIQFLTKHYNAAEGGVVLADEMGLGKTIQLLAFLGLVLNSEKNLGLSSKPNLLVAPKILFSNWKREAELWVSSVLLEPESILVLSQEKLNEFKKSSTELDIRKLAQYKLIIMNYHTLAAWQRELLRVDWGVAIFDESQDVKNPDTSKSRAARALKSQFVICSTGTPVENKLRDLWTQLDCLQRVPSHPLGTLEDFLEEEVITPSRILEIKRAIGYPGPHAIILRREKSVVTRLPKAVHHTHLISMTPLQVNQEQLITAAGNKELFKMLPKLQKLYQHPRLLTAESIVADRNVTMAELVEESPKFRWLIEQLELIKRESPGEKVLIFTVWTAMQDLLKKACDSHFGLRTKVVNGATNQLGEEHVQNIIDDFSNSVGFNVLVLSPLAAGAGLNITAANHVIHYGRWWNPAKEDQASGRAHRIKQTRDVQIHYPIMHHPDRPDQGFDVNLHLLVEKKRKLSTDFLNPYESDITAEELNALKGTT